MEKNQERMSNWSCVTQLLENEQPISLGPRQSSLMHRMPCRMLSLLTFYKFAAKMIGQKKRVLDVGCGEGLGSWIIAKECGFCKGIDDDAQAIASAQQNFTGSCIEFERTDLIKADTWDGFIYFECENIASHTFSILVKSLTDEGIAVIETSAQEGQMHSHDKLHAELSQFFGHVFIFSISEEMIHTSCQPFAASYLALCCKPNK